MDLNNISIMTTIFEIFRTKKSSINLPNDIIEDRGLQEWEEIFDGGYEVLNVFCKSEKFHYFYVLDIFITSVP